MTNKVSNEFYYGQLWNKVIEYIAKEKLLNEDVIHMLETDSKIFSIEQDKVIIICEFFLTTVVINTNAKELQAAFNVVFGADLKFIAKTAKELIPAANIADDSPLLKNYIKTTIDKKYTFENFVIGRSNAQSQLSAFTVAANPGYLYNPLFIYGNSGLGKTHLLNAIANKILEQFPNYKIGIISGLDFVEGVFDSIKNHQIDQFKKEFYNLDVLLVDDIQFIAGKEKTHEIFFSVFNELVNNKKQVCLTSDRVPKDIKGLEDRIISRFNQGLTVNIEAPEFETSINILKKKISVSEIQTIDDDVLSYIATNFSKDVRQLEGALNRLLFYTISFIPSEHITLKIAREAFQDQVSEVNDELDIDTIKKVVCNYYGITNQQLNSKIRTKNIAGPRQIAMYLARKRLDMSYKDIGNNFGKRDHSTVINACERVEERIKKDSMYQRAVMEIETALD